MASRYSSAPGKAERNFSEVKWELRQGSMIVFESITIFRLCSGEDTSSSTSAVASLTLEYFEIAQERPPEGKRDITKALPGRCPINFTSLVEFLRNGLQASQEHDHHEGCVMPHLDHDDGKDGPRWRGKLIEVDVEYACLYESIVDAAVFDAIQHAPDHRS
jgi:hypothetical protein